MYKEASELINAGLVVLPAKGKSPRVKWEQYQNEPPTALEYQRWFQNQESMWVLCGDPSGILVLDCDSLEAENWWRDRIGEHMDKTTCVKTAKGHHWWFKIPESSGIRSWSHHVGDMSYDVRSNGGGVMVPPSKHPSGGQYTWLRNMSHLCDLPEGFLSFKPDNETSESTTNVRSLLSDLLSNPPAEGGRNIWLTAVAGHYAKMTPFEDAYTAMLTQANQQLTQPLEPDEFTKTRDSIWETERKQTTANAPMISPDRWEDPNFGWLVGTGHCIYTMCKIPDIGADTFHTEPKPFTNFDIVVRGRSRSGDGELTYKVDICFDDLRPKVETVLSLHNLTSAEKVRRRLSIYGCTFRNPSGDMHFRVPMFDRIATYIDSQDAPEFVQAEYLGWHPKYGYLTLDSVLSKTGSKDASEVGLVPRFGLEQTAKYKYGVGSPSIAIDVLKEVLTFQDPVVCAIFGAWWAMLPFKGHILDSYASFFPFMAIEAPSESGKTTGFFSLMTQLNGLADGAGDFTPASFRDRVSAHRNGVVWLDDLSDFGPISDLVRQATSEGYKTKKGEDNLSNLSVRLVAPILLTGESIESVHNEKAMKDRAVILQVGSPTNRKSSIDPDKPQWEDIRSLHRRYPDLTCFAGDLVIRILQCENILDQFNDLRVGGGRESEKIATLRVGARVLAEITGDSSYIDIVDKWGQDLLSVYAEQDNYLLLKIIPTYLAAHPMIPTHAAGRPILYVDDAAALHFHIPSLADWWASYCSKNRLSDRQKTMGALKSIIDQKSRIPGTTTTRKSVLHKRPKGVTDQLAVYTVLPVVLSNVVISRGGSEIHPSFGDQTLEGM